MKDDLGHPVDLDHPAERVVSLVPSLTEALVSVRRAAVVGATDWCTHPRDLDVTRVRGTKNPDLDAIDELQTDVVITNKEENREIDVNRLRGKGIRVWVTDIDSVPGAIASMQQMFEFLGWDQPGWLAEAERLWAESQPVTRRVAVPIWRDPWMVVGGDTFTTDLLRRLGMENVFKHENRYPHKEIADIDGAGADVVLLPDEPYEFTEADGPEAFTVTPTELVDGRLLTWYGPSLLDAHRSIARA